MGKYPRSELHDWFSDWHWNLKNKKPDSKWWYLTDIDRIWIREKDEKPIAVFDIKTGKDEITYAESILYKWFLEKNLPVYIIKIDKNIPTFKVNSLQAGIEKNMTEEEFISWLGELHKRGY